MCSHCPLVSAVIPVYNGEAFIADAICSVLNQTYREIECIVVDDGSTDGTAAKLRSFGDAVRCIHKPNGGVASARNAGIAAARGAYVAFLDADDVWLPQKLELQLQLLRQQPELGLVYGSVHVVDEKLARIGEVVAPSRERALRNTLLLEPPPMAITMTGVVPVHVIEKVGGFDERMSTSADADFGCRIACDYPVDGIRQPTALYRQHGKQMHLNLPALEHDTLLIFEKFFQADKLPPDLASSQRRAYANLYVTLAAGYLHQGDRRRFLMCLIKALYHQPVRVGMSAGKRTVNRINRWKGSSA